MEDAPHRVTGGARRREEQIREAGVGLSLPAAPIEEGAGQALCRHAIGTETRPP